MSGPERIWLWKGDDLASELAVNPPKIATTEYTKYIRADLADPAPAKQVTFSEAEAIREKALREAAEALRSAQLFGRTPQEQHAALEQYCLCRDAILALIDKPAPDHSAAPGNMIDKGAG